MLFGMKETQFKSSLRTKQTDNQLFFSSPAVTTGSGCFFFVCVCISPRDACTFAGIYLAAVCLMCQMGVIICLLRRPGLSLSRHSAVIGKQSQIRFKSSFDLANLEDCQLLMGSERGFSRATDNINIVPSGGLTPLTRRRLYAECGLGESGVKYFS